MSVFCIFSPFKSVLDTILDVSNKNVYLLLNSSQDFNQRPKKKDFISISVILPQVLYWWYAFVWKHRVFTICNSSIIQYSFLFQNNDLKEINWRKVISYGFLTIFYTRLRRGLVGLISFLTVITLSKVSYYILYNPPPWWITIF